jgi:C4-dicarboxylate-specific signal transduction histidine kinase
MSELSRPSAFQARSRENPIKVIWLPNGGKTMCKSRARQTTIGKMTAWIVHEVRQPLAAIVANANAGLRWLQEPEPDIDEARAALTRIVREGHRTSDIISSVKRMFEKTHSDRSLVNVNGLIGEVLSLLRAKFENHKIALKSDQADGLRPVVADRVQLEQVLVNLILNAVDAMCFVVDREKLLTIKSEAYEPNQVRISIQDSGPGVDSDHMQHIFDDFITTKPHGMGMGLSICRSIVESLGGRIWVETRSPHGAIFCVQLPRVHSSVISSPELS